MRGPNLFAGYLNRPEATDEAMRDGWFFTGDLATVAEDGYWRIVGRRSTDLIKTGGYKVGAGEIEVALLEHPGVLEVAVTGEEDPDLGEKIIAWVVPDGERAAGEGPDRPRGGRARPPQAPARDPLPRRAAPQRDGQDRQAEAEPGLNPVLRRLPIGLLAAGLLLAVVLPIAGFGRLPFLLGLACLVAAGIATRRAAFALAGIAAAVLLFFVPGFVTDRRNDRGHRVDGPEGRARRVRRSGTRGHRARTAAGGSPRATSTRARGAGGSRFQMATAGVEVRRVGRTLLVSDRADALRALDLATGKQRWDTPPVANGYRLPAVANPELVASSVCRGGPGCTAEVRSIADGKLRWSAPTFNDWLGSPPIAQALGVDRPLWPASAVVLETGREGERYEVRHLETGKVVVRGRSSDTSLAVTGNLFLRDTGKGVLSATDVATGNMVWTRERGRAGRRPRARRLVRSGSGSPTAR